MRLVKVRIRAGDIAKNEDQMMYPDRYNPVEVDRHGMHATQLNIAPVSLSGEIGRGGAEEFCIIALPDALAEEYALDPEMMIIDSTEADTLMEQWRVQNNIPEESVLDTTRMTAIRAKQEAGIALSTEDLDALDVTKPMPGINKSRTPVTEKLQGMGKAVNDDLISLPADRKTITPVNRGA